MPLTEPIRPAPTMATLNQARMDYHLASIRRAYRSDVDQIARYTIALAQAGRLRDVREVEDSVYAQCVNAGWTQRTWRTLALALTSWRGYRNSLGRNEVDQAALAMTGDVIARAAELGADCNHPEELLLPPPHRAVALAYPSPFRDNYTREVIASFATTATPPTTATPLTSP